jgi:pimeloyl-ACP methyl ester carboxylesterase
MARDAKKRTLKVDGAVLYYETRGEGPLLVMIPGGPTDAEFLLPLAEKLIDRFKVVTYDPRGNSRSQFDGEPVDQDMNVHGDDIAALIREFDHGPAFVFGTSGGAQIGLSACARHPQLIRRLIAHEPPCASLLPEVAQLVRAMNQIKETFQKSGAAPAMGQFMRMTEPKEPRESEQTPALVERAKSSRSSSTTSEARAPSPFMKLNLAYFFEHGMLPIALYQPEIAKLQHSDVVIAIGTQSEGQLAYRAGIALAQALGTQPVIFPGDHRGWARSPEAFATVLAEQLSSIQK